MAWGITFGFACGLALGVSIGSCSPRPEDNHKPASLEPRPEMPDPILELEDR